MCSEWLRFIGCDVFGGFGEVRTDSSKWDFKMLFVLNFPTANKASPNVSWFFSTKFVEVYKIFPAKCRMTKCFSVVESKRKGHKGIFGEWTEMKGGIR